LKTLLQVAEEENQRLQEKLQAMKMQTGEDSMNEMVVRPFCDHGNFTSYGFKHDNANSCTHFVKKVKMTSRHPETKEDS
jgi:hypothetical protein